MDAVYTVGHSTHPIEKFIGLLKSQTIAALCDVRSRPYSRMNSQFDREALKGALAENGIKYVFLGKELGARSEDKNCYLDGQVQFDLLAATSLFNRGIERVVEGAQNYRIALMCAEKEPLECHRTILVARKLHESGISIKHILADGRIERHEEAMDRLLLKLRIGQDMFRSREAVVKEAYALQANEIAYREKEDPENMDLEMFTPRALPGRGR